MRGFYCLLALVIAASLLAGCGEGSNAETADGSAESQEKRPQGPGGVWITLDGKKGPENIGVVLPHSLGYFEDLGIEISVTSPVTVNSSIPYVTERTVQFGVTHQPQLVLAQEKGAPIVAVASLVPRPTAAMIWLEKSGIDGIADLKGKTIAIPGLPFQRDFLAVILERAGLTLEDVKVKSVGYELVPELTGGPADAIFGGSWNVEGAQLAAAGLRPVITRVQDLGIPAYDELVLITRTDLAAKDPQLVREVVSVVNRGTAAAVEHPDSLPGAIVRTGESDPYATRKGTEAGLDATLPLLSELGYIDSSQATDLVDWMQEEGLIRRKPPIPHLLTNRYLPFER